MATKRTLPAEALPDDGGDAPRTPRIEQIGDLIRAQRKAQTKIQEARTLEDRIAQNEALDRASSANVTIENYMPWVEKAMLQPARAGAAKADTELHRRIVRKAKSFLNNGHKPNTIVRKVHEAIEEACSTQTIRRVLKSADLVSGRPKK